MSNNSNKQFLFIANLLEKHALLIANNWLKDEPVKDIFSARKISRIKFRDGYALEIIKYFIAVIRQEKNPGDCPVMRKFVHLMLQHNITPKEVFLICMGFRKSLTILLFQSKKVLQAPLEYMNKITPLFNANLAGVLDIFNTLYSENQKKIEITKAEKSKLQKTTNIINSINTKILIIQDKKIILANQPFFEMLGLKDLKELENVYLNSFTFFQNISLYEKEFIQDAFKWIEKVCEENKHFQVSIKHSSVNEVLSYSGRITKIADESPTQYIITLSNITDHVKNEAMLENILSHDEITGFKNYANFEKYLKEQAEAGEEKETKSFLAVVDAVNLREINSENGREAGDMIISEIAEDLRFLENENTKYARLEGSRFGIYLEYATEQIAYDWCIKLHHRLKTKNATIDLAITEIDNSQSVNKLLIRVYKLLEEETHNKVVKHDLLNILEYKQLEEQSTFTQELAKKNSLEANLYFQEIPVSAKTKIVSTDENNIYLQLSAKQMSIVAPNMPIYFKITPKNCVVANISKVDDNTSVATVNEFRNDKHSPLNRKALRVHVDNNEDIEGYIAYHDNDFPIKVLDMNHQCVAIEIDRKRNININDIIFLDLLLPLSNGKKSCRTDSSVTRINKTPDGYKIVLLCHLDDKNQDLISQFISEQQMKTIKIMNR